MQILEILNKEPIPWFNALNEHCSQFLTEANGVPLVKSLPSHYPDIHRVKVRKRKKKDAFNQTFNEAFEHHHPHLRQRAVFANGIQSTVDDPGTEPFYIFPVDGYKFMYSKEVQNSNQEYREVFESIMQKFGVEKGNQVVTDLLKFTYTQTELHEGLSSGSEIIIFNIPFYYALRRSVWKDYDSLLTQIESFN